MSLTIYGASDDLVEVEGHLDEEYDAAGVDEVTLRIVGADGEIGVVMRYAPGGYGDHGCWSAEIRQPAEDAPIPWPVSIDSHHTIAYTVKVEVGCPDDVTVERLLLGGLVAS